MFRLKDLNIIVNVADVGVSWEGGFWPMCLMGRRPADKKRAETAIWLSVDPRLGCSRISGVCFAEIGKPKDDGMFVGTGVASVGAEAHRRRAAEAVWQRTAEVLGLGEDTPLTQQL